MVQRRNVVRETQKTDEIQKAKTISEMSNASEDYITLSNERPYLQITE